MSDRARKEAIVEKTDTPEIARRPCPGCGGPRLVGYIACRPCWDTLPAALTEAWYRARGLEKNRAAVRGIVEYLKGHQRPAAPPASATPKGSHGSQPR